MSAIPQGYSDLLWRLRDLERRVANLISIGVVFEVDTQRSPPAARVKVGDIRTDFLQWCNGRAGENQTWWAPSVGEQVCVFAPSGDLRMGLIGPAYAYDEFPSPTTDPAVHTTVYADGTEISYDQNTSSLRVQCVGDVEVEAAGDISVRSEGNLDAQIDGNANVDAKGSLTAAAVGDAKVESRGGVEVTAVSGITLNSVGDINLKSAGVINVTGALGVSLVSSSGIGLIGPQTTSAGTMMMPLAFTVGAGSPPPPAGPPIPGGASVPLPAPPDPVADIASATPDPGQTTADAEIRGHLRVRKTLVVDTSGSFGGTVDCEDVATQGPEGMTPLSLNHHMHGVDSSGEPVVTPESNGS